MWQMTWDEYGKDSVKPTEEPNPHGTIYYRCGVCGDYVGIFATKKFHETGWLHRRDKCANGHVVDWKGIQE